MKLKTLKNVIVREFKIFFKSWDLLLICIGTPLLFSFMFSALYHNRRATDINIGIINEDNTAMSRKLVRDFDASEQLKVRRKPGQISEAYPDIFRNDFRAFYFIPKNFSSNLKKGKSAPAFNAADASSFILSSNALKTFTQISLSFSQKQFAKILTEKGYSYKEAKTAFSPINADIRHIFNANNNYSDFLIPGLLFAVLQQILLVSICTTIITDKNSAGRKELYKVSEGSFAAAFLGKIIPYACTGIMLTAVYALAVFPANGIFVGSLAGYFILSAAFIIAISAFAVLISSFFKSQEMVMAVLMFYAMPAVLLSGFIWPHHALPKILKVVSYLFPSTYALNEIRLFILGDIALKYVAIPSVCLITFAAACFFLSFLVSNKKFSAQFTKIQ
ncbi:MAG: ABC transporter permease [Endomicrobium sp.]|jgi:ABC-2 type transport system permease protein|nr:ABC transporter permease [Endomicrobium sp.]